MILLPERWAWIKGYRGKYRVSTHGRVRSVTRLRPGINVVVPGRMLRMKPNKSGYLRAPLSKNNKCRHYFVARLVALTFIPNPKNLPEVNHKDLNKLNNRADNLEWVTKRRNMDHLLEHRPRKGEGACNVKLNWKKVRRIRKLWASGQYYQRELASMFHVKMGAICHIVTNRNWKE